MLIDYGSAQMYGLTLTACNIIQSKFKTLKKCSTLVKFLGTNISDTSWNTPLNRNESNPFINSKKLSEVTPLKWVNFVRYVITVVYFIITCNSSNIWVCNVYVYIVQSYYLHNYVLIYIYLSISFHYKEYVYIIHL